MKHFDIEAQNNLGLPTYETRPTFTTEYLGKLIYETSTNKILYGGSSGWTEPGGGGGSTDIIRRFNIGPWTTLNIVGISTITVNVRPNWPGLEPGVGLAYVTPADCLISVHGGVGTLTYYISKTGGEFDWQSNTDPTKCQVGFGCPQIGINSVFVKVTDSSGQQDSVELAVVVQDRDSICYI